MTHFPALLLSAFFISVVFGWLTKRTTKERILYAAKSFLLFVLISVALGWLMYPLSK